MHEHALQSLTALYLEHQNTRSRFLYLRSWLSTRDAPAQRCPEELVSSADGSQAPATSFL